MASNPPLSLITIPPELCRLVLGSLSSHDVAALRQVSREYYEYFTSEDLCHFAHKLYFPLSSEARKSQRTRQDFDATYSRSQRWKQGKPSHVEIIDEVAFGSTSLSNGFLVDSAAGLLAYQRSRGVIVLKGLGCIDDDTVGPDIFIDLEAELGECVMKRSESIFLRDGESIRMAMNGDILLVVGEAHIHPVPHENLPGGRGLGILSTLWNWTWGTPASHAPGSRNIPPRQFFQHPHTLCAVFSTAPHNRGKLLWTWFERDSFIMESALNEFYAITEFDLVEQRLEGYIFPQTKKARSKRFSLTSNKEPVDDAAVVHQGHHFTIKKKSLYPPLSTFTIAPDTRGKVFYLGFLPPSTDRRPVVEVHALPQFNPEDGTWSECTVIKRVTLRSLGSHARGMNGSVLNSSFWIDFEVGTRVRNLKNPKTEPSGKFARDPEEDIVRVRMKGDLFIPGITSETEQVNMVTWDVTARPSPRLPSRIAEWRQGQEWAVNPEDPQDLADVPLYRNAQGCIDFEEIYPSPTYNVKERNRDKFLSGLEVLPDGVDLDRLEGGNESGLYPPYFWTKDEERKNRTIYAVYSEMSANTIMLDPQRSAEEGCGGVVSSLPPHEAVVYPNDPGRDDKAFVPAGRLMKPKYMVCLETGRKVEVRDVAKCSNPPTTRKSKLFGRFWGEEHQRDNGDEGEGSTTATTSATAAAAAGSNAAAAAAGSPNFVDLPLPGFDDARDRVLTRMDKHDKRYWVYGKEAEIRRKGEVLEERIGDKIVIVRFD